MKVFSWNVNGLRAVYKKGALDSFLDLYKPDVLLIQEIKGKEEQFVDEGISSIKNYKMFFNPAEKPGYSGVAVFVNTKHKDVLFEKGMPGYKDGEGRVVTVLLKDLACVGVYVPNGGKSDEAYAEKLGFYSLLAKYADKLNKERSVIIAGDFNVARSELDLAEPEKHLNHTHFCPEVRDAAEEMTRSGFVDTFRTRYPDKKEAYSYWDNFSFSLPRGTKPRDINKGWRLDYIFADAVLNKKIKDSYIHTDVMGSDHCPVSVHIS